MVGSDLLRVSDWEYSIPPPHLQKSDGVKNASVFLYPYQHKWQKLGARVGSLPVKHVYAPLRVSIVSASLQHTVLPIWYKVQCC